MINKEYTQEEIQLMLNDLSDKKLAKMSDSFLESVENRHNSGVYSKTSNRMKDRVVREETREKISNSKKGKKLSDEHIKKLKEISKKNKYYLKGAEVWSNQSDERHKEVGKKSGNSRLGRKASDEHKKNISESLKGVPKSEEHRKKLSDAKKNVVLSEEAKSRIRAAARVEYHCSHCNSNIKGRGNFSRWHGDNCKKKPII